MSEQLSEIRPRTIGTQVRDLLRDKIISGVLTPGERLTETDLAAKLNISRGPLREAILQLTEEGLLIKAPYKGLRVRSLSQSELSDLTELRTALERFAFEQAWDNRTPDTLADLRGRFAVLEKARVGDELSNAVQAEVAFHSWVYELSGNKLLMTHWEKMVPLLQIYMSIHQTQHGAAGAQMTANREYLEMAQGDDLAAMLAHLVDHMLQGQQEVRNLLPAI